MKNTKILNMKQYILLFLLFATNSCASRIEAPLWLSEYDSMLGIHRSVSFSYSNGDRFDKEISLAKSRTEHEFSRLVNNQIKYITSLALQESDVTLNNPNQKNDKIKEFFKESTDALIKAFPKPNIYEHYVGEASLHVHIAVSEELFDKFLTLKSQYEANLIKSGLDQKTIKKGIRAISIIFDYFEKQKSLNVFISENLKKQNPEITK